MTGTRLDRRALLGGLAASGALIGLAPMAARQALAQASAPLRSEVKPGTAIILADDANGARSLLEQSGQQEKLAAKVGYANFSSGPLRLEAIRAGAAQLGAVGDVPPILAHFSNANVLIVGAVQGRGSGSLITTAPGSGIKALADLKGRKVGINQGTAQQAILLRNLKAAGLTIKDIQPINLGLAEFADALRGRQIDAAVLKQPDRSRYLASVPGTDALELDSAPGANPNLAYLYATRSALDDPDQAAAIRDLVIRWYRAHAWKNANKDAWIEGYYVRNQKLKPEDAASAYDTQGETFVPGFTRELIAIQQETIDVLQAAGSFAGRQLKAEDEFDLRFANLTAADKTANE
ncbi:ABC transporter substrate-binding protein [Bosea sp. BK604]|uniref:ABC transporter substrate-binding protein n=1 Tax=Bosea sp. BK604 TaxID=2512180 RepID=UPI0010D37EC9|nr:ABC transporter substrate-binding protein [Bosea sp. BK604]TCR61547.1 sulfonate transport system substrate-binding protein [Bosea sp. BK604]